jgi:Domain of unknown function (DUF4148)
MSVLHAGLRICHLAVRLPSVWASRILSVAGRQAGHDSQTQPHFKETIMNTTKLIAALALSFAASGAALAQEATYEYPQVSTSTVTRAQVIAELQQARLDGSYGVTERDTYKPAVFIAQRSRADVRAEAMAAAATGEQNHLHGETNAFDVAVKPAGSKTEAMAVANTRSVR